MGIDASILFVDRRVSAETLVESTRRAFQDEAPDNLVILYGSAGPASVEEAFPQFTVCSLWADDEVSPGLAAAEMSRILGRVLVITMADHACVGAWHLFVNGHLREMEWLDEDHTDGGIRGIAHTYGITLQPDETERTFFAEAFLEENQGVCVFGTAPPLSPGRHLSAAECTAVMEQDLGDVQLECMLMEEG